MTPSDIPSRSRRALVPILVTIVAVIFWVEYYKTVSWWPAVLFAIWSVNYAAYNAKHRHKRSDNVA